MSCTDQPDKKTMRQFLLENCGLKETGTIFCGPVEVPARNLYQKVRIDDPLLYRAHFILFQQGFAVCHDHVWRKVMRRWQFKHRSAPQ